jgi:hypothetical protein
LPLSIPKATVEAVEAVEAGDDMVLFDLTGSAKTGLALAEHMSDALVGAVNSGRLPKSELVSAGTGAGGQGNRSLPIPQPVNTRTPGTG